MRLDAELLLLAAWATLGGCLDMFGHSVRVLIEACSVQQVRPSVVATTTLFYNSYCFVSGTANTSDA